MAIFTKLHKRSGVTFYYVRVVGPDGRRIKEKAGTTEKQAIKKEKVLLGQIAAGEWTDPRKAKKESVTFGTMLDRFIADHAHLWRSDYYPERAKLLRSRFGDRPIASITQDDLDDFRRDREAGMIEGLRKVAPSTVKKDLTVLGTLFHYAMRKKVIKIDPTFDLRKPRDPRVSRRAFTLEEYQKIRDAAQWMTPMIRLAVVTGMDLKEVVGLRWDDLDLPGTKMDLIRGKTGVPLSIPIGKVAAEVLEQTGTRFRGGYVFRDSEGHDYTSQRSRNQIGKNFTALVVRLGLRRRGEGRELEDGPSFKTLRATAATWASKAGHPDAHISFLLGHSRKETMTSRYIDLNADDLRGIIRSLDTIESGSQPAPQVNPTLEGVNEESENLKSRGELQTVGT